MWLNFNNVPVSRPIELAKAAVEELGDLDDWTAVVVPNPKNPARAIVKVYDEDGEFLGYL